MHAEVTDVCANAQAPPPSSNASPHEKMDFLHCQLDSLKGQQVLSGLVLQEGSSNRLQGGMP